MSTSQRQLEINIKAAYPITYVVTHEENRLLESVASIIHGINTSTEFTMQVITWSITEGVIVYDSRGAIAARDPNQDSPDGVIDWLLKFESSAVLILKDYRHFLEDNLVIQRKLRDAAELITSSEVGKNIIISGTTLCIPEDLEKIVSVIDWDLPKEDEISRVLLQAEKELSKELTFNERAKLVEACKGMTLIEAENVLAKSLVEHRGQLKISTILEEKKAIVRKSGVLTFCESSGNMDDIGGLETLKIWLRQRAKSFGPEAKKYGLRDPRGVLVVGLPGTGKSLVSKTMGNAWGMPVLQMDIGSLFGSLVGQSEANLRKALKTAEAIAPCVLYIDEIEKGFGKGDNDGGTSTRVFGSFLSWMQDREHSVFVIASANSVTDLPPEFLRAGRFDAIFFSDLPVLEERKDIFSIHIRKNKRKPSNFDLDTLAVACPDFSGAEIEQVVVEALYSAFPKEPVDDDFLKAIGELVPLAKTMPERIEALREWASVRARPAGMLRKAKANPRKVSATNRFTRTKKA
jgi:ATP-dependent 26S proteasome regulatory subunit